jgi:hypothetical protein
VKLLPPQEEFVPQMLMCINAVSCASKQRPQDLRSPTLWFVIILIIHLYIIGGRKLVWKCIISFISFKRNYIVLNDKSWSINQVVRKCNVIKCPNNLTTSLRNLMIIIIIIITIIAAAASVCCWCVTQWNTAVPFIQFSCGATRLDSPKHPSVRFTQKRPSYVWRAL